MHPAYEALARSPAGRTRACLALPGEALADDELRAIRMHLQQQRVLGRDALRAMIEAKARRCAGVRPAHRPRTPPRQAPRAPSISDAARAARTARR
jgi:putative transposase